MAVVPYVRATHSRRAKLERREGEPARGRGTTTRPTRPPSGSRTTPTQSSRTLPRRRSPSTRSASTRRGTLPTRCTTTPRTTTRLTCRYAGVYQITANASLGSDPGYESTYMRFRVNGSDKHCAAGRTRTRVDNATMLLTTLYALAVNDYVEVRVTQSSGGRSDIC